MATRREREVSNTEPWPSSGSRPRSVPYQPPSSSATVKPLHGSGSSRTASDGIQSNTLAQAPFPDPDVDHQPYHGPQLGLMEYLERLKRERPPEDLPTWRTATYSPSALGHDAYELDTTRSEGNGAPWLASISPGSPFSIEKYLGEPPGVMERLVYQSNQGSITGCYSRKFGRTSVPGPLSTQSEGKQRNIPRSQSWDSALFKPPCSKTKRDRLRTPTDKKKPQGKKRESPT